MILFSVGGGGGQIKRALFYFFVVKKCPFCIFWTLPSVSKITTEYIQVQKLKGLEVAHIFAYIERDLLRFI